MEAIILAGGFGTRLSHIVSDVPKPMANVNEKPFLEYIIRYLIKNNVDHIVLAIGYKGDIIRNYFGEKFLGAKISYSSEYEPLGTGGAIKKALELCEDNDVLIINGDTFYEVDLNQMNSFHINNLSNLTIAVKRMKDFERYGAVVVENSLVVKFEEKQKIDEGLINGGTYLINKSVFKDIYENAFSFETVVLEDDKVDIYAFEDNGYFIDIGVPDDYYRAQKDFSLMYKVNKAIFLDRDGTINKEVNYLFKTEELEFIDGAIESIKYFNEIGYKVIVLTNQAGVARGYYDEEKILELHEYISSILEKNNSYIDSYYYCPHHPEGVVEKYRGICSCRKPNTGMIEQSALEYNIDLKLSVMVGDKESDIIAGKKAGVGTNILVRSGHNVDEKSTIADAVYDDLYEFKEYFKSFQAN